MLVTVDTGGTKTLVASFAEDGVLHDPLKFPTPRDQAEYVSLLRKTLVERYGDQDVEAVVIALPGIIRDGVAVWCNNLGWKNFDVGAALKGVLGAAPILVENDANLGGLAEARMLENTPISSLYVTISTGIGSGLIVHGHIDPGMRNSEAGHSQIYYDGQLRGWETFASGGAIYRAYDQYARDITDPAIWQDVAERISLGFLAIIPAIQPDIIIIGGSMGTHFAGYSQQLQALLAEKLPDHISAPTLIAARYPEEAVIYGCYYYALDTLGRS